MDTFKKRLPSRQEALQLLAVCTFLVYSWSILHFFRKLPSWILFLSYWDVASIFAYVLAFALIESIVVFSILILCCLVLPTWILRDGFVSKGSTLLIMNAFWASVFHPILLSDHILSWSPGQYALSALLYLASMGVSWYLVHRSHPISRALNSFAERLTVFLYVYIPLGVLGILGVLARNIL